MKEELDKNIFGAEDSWPGVKQELDRHFRKKRIVFWLSAMSVVGILLFSTFWLNTNFHKVTPQVNNETSIEIKPSQDGMLLASCSPEWEMMVPRRCAR